MNLDAQNHPLAHSRLTQFLHWGFLLLFGYAIFKGLDDVNQLKDNDLLNFEITFAGIFLIILAMRFILTRKRPSVLTKENAPKTYLAAKLVHLAMYGSIAMIAISGLIIGAFAKMDQFNGVWVDATIGLHEFSLSASYLLIAAHVAAAVYHRLLGDGIWSTMVPFWRE